MSNETKTPNKRWTVTVFDGAKPYMTEWFDRRGVAAAYAMRWNKCPNIKYRAELKAVTA